jgi:hypothetical protein
MAQAENVFVVAHSGAQHVCMPGPWLALPEDLLLGALAVV